MPAKSPPSVQPHARTATLSDCGRYRYTLARTWDDARDVAAFIMLNPSTADAAIDDPTIRRCVGFARSWGLGGIDVRNLFALRATDPRALKSAADPVGPDNDRTLEDLARLPRLAVVVAAWGTHGTIGGRDRRVAGILASLRRRGVVIRCLGLTRGGHPGHPLYLPAAARLVPYPPEATP